jgi:hypothetical protein
MGLISSVVYRLNDSFVIIFYDTIVFYDTVKMHKNAVTCFHLLRWLRCLFDDANE